MILKELQRFINPIFFIQNFDTEVLELNIVFEKTFNINSLGWLSDKNILRLNDIKTGNVIISNSVIFNPATVNIGPNVVIEDDVQIGDFCEIGANTVLKKGIILKSNISIGSNCTLGGVGFGYEKDKEGNYRVIHHIGNVFISDFVEIGNNVCIDRAVIGSTQIGRNVKIDNLVHIAHGVKIDENSLIIANAMIGGSVSIGKNVWISPSVSIRQKLTIQDDSLIGMGSVVVKDVQKNDIVLGVPAKSIKN